ncbi:unnamed protein product [Echinostoma caproni]|uniref:TPR_REGION domain-containing protein n=1 Tax=Echinostoma caproni TaxID=27848 RepID=A0A183AW54_9TREM|nr:unnamed protein product [Echinostoma caproni]
MDGVNWSSRVYGTSNLIYANLLLEYGCLLLNTDKTRKAAQVYVIGFALTLSCLPGASVMSALALEAIAYAHYVLEYTTGDFNYAFKCADVASLILHRLNHQDCMQTASANRVKALIIEEIAIDANDPRRFKQAEELHIQSLRHCEKTYGERNIQTAKHYGNLGRLYQSMQLYERAELNHRKAIAIKTELLGESDFEVGLSLGHLASLYNYDMERYQDAEALHLKSIEISRRVFGPTYSGLEYEYRGLQRVYHHLGLPERREYYMELRRDWHTKRERLSQNPESADQIDELTSAEQMPNVRTLWTELLQLFTEYERKFSQFFRGFPYPNSVNDVPSGSKSVLLNTVAKVSPTLETSRSTGY